MKRCISMSCAIMSLLAVALLAAAPAWAQSSGSEDHGDDGEQAADMPWVDGVTRAQRQRANQIFQEGNALIRDGLFARAAERYQEALALWDHPGFRYNLAIAQINLDQPILAYESFLHAVRFGVQPLGEDRHAQAQSFLTLLRNQLAEIEVVCDEPGAVVTVDGKSLFTAPGRAQRMALPGGHQLMADVPGRLPDTKQIVLAPGQRARFRLAPRLPAYLATERRWAAWGPWTVTGAGLATVAAGGVVNWRAGAAFERHDREAGRLCASPAGCAAADVPAGLGRQLDRAERTQLGARITYAAGAAVLATGAVLLYLNRERPVRRRGLVRASRMSLLPVLAPRVVGLGAGLVF